MKRSAMGLLLFYKEKSEENENMKTYKIAVAGTGYVGSPLACYHATNEGDYISWYDFTKEIYRQARCKTEVLPVTTAEYGLSKAARLFNSRLDKSKLVEAGFTPLPTWQDALSRYLKEIEQ